MRQSAFVIVLSLILLIPPLSGYFVVNAPAANSEFYRVFAFHEQMIYNQSTLEGIESQILAIWQEMNRTWPDVNKWNTTWNTFWFPDQTYGNSLMAENDYLGNTVRRIDKAMMDMQTANETDSTLIPYEQYYQQTVQNETQNLGDLFHSIRGVWYLQFAPLANWIWGLEVLWIIVLTIGAVIILPKTKYYS
jgi:hypothetical protein